MTTADKVQHLHLFITPANIENANSFVRELDNSPTFTLEHLLDKLGVSFSHGDQVNSTVDLKTEFTSQMSNFAPNKCNYIGYLTMGGNYDFICYCKSKMDQSDGLLIQFEMLTGATKAFIEHSHLPNGVIASTRRDIVVYQLKRQFARSFKGDRSVERFIHDFENNTI